MEMINAAGSLAISESGKSERSAGVRVKGDAHGGSRAKRAPVA